MKVGYEIIYGFRNGENIFDLRVTPEGQRSRSNPKNSDVEYLENGTEIERKCQQNVK